LLKKTIHILRILMIIIGVIWTFHFCFTIFSYHILEKIDMTYRIKKESERDDNVVVQAYRAGLGWGKIIGDDYSMGQIDENISNRSEAYQYANKYLEITRKSSKICEDSYDEPMYCGEIPSDDLILLLYGKHNEYKNDLVIGSFHSGFFNGFIDYLVHDGAID
jgi:hypothetical protein